MILGIVLFLYDAVPYRTALIHSVIIINDGFIIVNYFFGKYRIESNYLWYNITWRYKEMDSIITNYGQERDFDATDEEHKIFANICMIVNRAGLDASPIRMTAKSNSYVSAVIGPSDVARFKFTPRAAWIQLPYAANERGKRPITDPDDVFAFEREILGQYHLALGNFLLGY